jgi:hypothetical protein
LRTLGAWRRALIRHPSFSHRMPIGDSSHQISVVVHQHAQLVVFPELEPLADTLS